MGDYDDPRLTGRADRHRWGYVVLAIATLVVGLVAGYLLRSASEPSAVVSAPATSAPASPPATTEPPATPSPCAEVAQHGTDLIAELERAARAIGELDPSALRAVLDEVKRLRAELQRDVDACRGRVADTPEATIAPPTAPAPSTPR